MSILNFGNNSGRSRDYNDDSFWNFDDLGGNRTGKGGASTGGEQSSWLNREGAFGKSGWAMPAVQGIGVGVQAWSAIQGHKMAKKQLGENKRQFNLNFNNQASLMEEKLKSQHRMRANAGMAEGSADDYVKSVGLKRA